MILNPCHPKDLTLLRQISLETYVETFEAVNTPANMQSYLQQAFNTQRLSDELAEPHSQFFLAYKHDQVTGYFKINNGSAQTEFNDPNALELERIYVLRRYQGQGLGQQLLNAVINIANEQQKQWLFLGVWEHNQKALAFYQRNGFYRIGQHIFNMGDDPQTDYLLRKDLT